MGVVGPRRRRHRVLRGLTTFSTFAVETAEFLGGGRSGMAAIYTTSSLIVAILAAVSGAATRRRVRALSLPLEGGENSG